MRIWIKYVIRVAMLLYRVTTSILYMITMTIAVQAVISVKLRTAV